METMSIEIALPLEEIESEADFVLCSEQSGVLSEHYTAGEARMAFFEEASRHSLGERLPVIYCRQDPYWVRLS
jgi:hypothetical protein